jgi:nitrite reductase/ring-hydroxylating ferredoxin subunit
MFPIWINGKQYHLKDFAYQAARVLPHRREIAVGWVGEDRVQAIEKRCTQLGFDPKLFE